MDWRIKVWNLWVKLEGLCSAKSWCIIISINHVGHSVTVWVFLPVAKSGNYKNYRTNWIRPTITAYSSITWSSLEYDLLQWFVPTQDNYRNILVNSPRGTIKAKKNSMSFNWCFGRCNRLKSHWTRVGWTWLVWFGLVLWYINHSRLYHANSIS